MDPNSTELLRSSPRVNLPVEEVGNRFIVEGNMRQRADLFDQLHIFNKQQVVSGSDPEPTDFGVSVITQV